MKIKKILAGVLAFTVISGTVGNYIIIKKTSMTSNALNYTTENYSAYAEQVAYLVNEERAKNGLEPVQMSSVMNQAADVRVNELTELFDHTRPDGTVCFTIFDEYNIPYMDCAAENIHSGSATPERAMNSWMNSSGHRANILDEDAKYIGVSVVCYEETYYWVQLFSDMEPTEGDIYLPVGSTPAETTTTTTTTTTTATTATTTTKPSTGTASAEDYTQGTYENLKYYKYSDHIVISGYENPPAEIVIPSEIDGLPVTSIGEHAFMDCRNLTSIKIPNSVTSIGDSAFFVCSVMTSINIPDSVTSIGRGAFSGCTGLTSITVEKNNPNYADIDGVLFNKDFSEIISYPIGKKESSYKIPNSVTKIGDSAFEDCSNLTSITIPDGVTSIGTAAFDGCFNLTSITIPDSVTSIGGGGAFNNGALDSTPWYKNQPDGLVYAGKVAYKYKGEMPENTEIILKDDTVGIAGYAFSNCTGLTSITIPEGVKEIGEWAFSGCKGLTSITIPDSVKEIGNLAFQQCSGLTSITIPEGVTSIGVSAFLFCTGLTSVTIPDSVISIDTGAFTGCSGLTSITIPDSVTSIGMGTFSSCSSLASITIENPECQIYDYEYTISDTATIYGYSNSTAQTYAEKYNRKFVALDDVPTTGTSTVTGDANGDGTIDVADVVSISAYIADPEKNPLPEQAVKICDVHNTGDGLTPNDSLMIQQFIAGIITEL